MIEVRLYGHLGRNFGRTHKFDIQSPAEAVSALKANYPKFEKYMIEHSTPGYFIYVGEENISINEFDRCTQKTIRFVPVVTGSNGRGKSLLQIVVGALIVFFVPGGQGAGLQLIRSAGVSLILSGVGGLLFRPPKQTSTEEPENEPSYAFDGPVNTTTQGNPVPICYGRLRVGGQVVSAGLSVDQLLPYVN